MRYKLNFDIEGEGLISSLDIISECITVVERSSVCEGVVLDVPDGCDRKFDVEILTITGCRRKFPYQLCDGNAQCDACEDCVDNLCYPKCEGACNEGDCVECTDEVECAGDLVCIQGTCRCPVGTTRVGDLCLITQEDCAACHTYNATTNECDPLPCASVDSNSLDECAPSTGVCDATNNRCVECLNDVHCDGGAICENYECVCPPGTYRDAFTQTCLPIPSCETAEDCPNCFICLEGKCSPVICPVGQECLNNTCVQTCNDDTNCPNGQYCVDGICTPNPPTGNCPPTPCDTPSDCNIGCGCVGICIECSQFNCEFHNDCPNGCYCDGGVCAGFDPDNPPDGNYCDAPCDNVLDCLEGCGCDQGEERCIRCEQVSCQTNANCPQGCYCDNGICRGITDPDGETPCENVTCQTSADCGIDCGCSEGLCIPCATLSCTETECGDVSGCECNQTGDCVGSPPYNCLSVSCNADEDCGEGCICSNGICIPSGVECENVTCVTDEECGEDCECIGGVCLPKPICEDELKIEKGDCELTATLSTSSSCQCPTIGIGIGISKLTKTFTGWDIKVRVELRKGNFVTYNQFIQNPLLGDTLIENDLPTAGSVKLKLLGHLRELDINGNFVGTSTITEIYGNTTLPLQNTDFNDANFLNVPDVGTNIIIGSKTYKLVRLELRQEPGAQFVFPNTCRANSETRIIYNLTQTGALSAFIPMNVAYSLSNQVLTRPPLLRIYTKQNNANSLIILANLLKGKYGFSLTIPSDELVHRNRYVVTSDCGCDPIKYHDCGDGSADQSDAVPLVFCEPDTFNFETIECGRRLRFLNNVQIDCEVLINAPATYQLFVNDNILIATKNVQPNGTLFIAGETYLSPEPITSATLKIVGDACEQCDVTIPAIPQPLEIEASFDTVCDSSETVNLNVTVSNGSPTYTFQLYRNGVGVSLTTNTSLTDAFTIPVAPLAGTYRLVVISANGCQEEVEIEFTPEIINIADLFSVSLSCGTGFITITTTSLTSEHTLDVSILGATEQGGSPSLNTQFFLSPNGQSVINNFPLLPTATFEYSVGVQGSNCPHYEEDFAVTCNNPDTIPTNTLFYECEFGVIYDNVYFVEIWNGTTYVPLAQNTILSPGTKYVRVTLGISTAERTFVVPQCYACQAALCVPAPNNVNAGYNTSTCLFECSSPTANPITIDYSCATGLVITPSVPVEVYFNNALVGNGAIIPAGNRIFTVIETDTSTQFTVSQQIQQCVACIEDCDCQEFKTCNFFFDIADVDITVDAINTGGIWSGENYVGGTDLVTADPLTADFTIVPPDVDTNTCFGLGASCENGTAIQDVVDYINTILPIGYLAESLDCKQFFRLTYPSCDSLYMSFTMTLGGTTVNRIIGYDANTGTIKQYLYFNGALQVDPVFYNVCGIDISGECEDAAGEENCCADASPNIGSEECPPECAEPVTPVCEDCTQLIFTTAASDNEVLGIRYIGTSDWLFQDGGGYTFTVPSNIERFIDDFTAAINADYPLSSAHCFRGVTVETIADVHFIYVSCMCNADVPTNWELVTTTDEYAETTDTCPDFPLEGCVCVEREVVGRNITGILTSAGNIFDDPIFTKTLYITQFEADRNLLIAELIEYYSEGNPSCLVDVNVTYANSNTTITISCLDSDIFEVPLFVQTQETQYSFNVIEECECDVNPCATSTFEVGDFTIDYNCPVGLTIIPNVGYTFRYGNENGHLIDPDGTILLAGNDQTIWISDGVCSLTTTVNVPACYKCIDAYCSPTLNNEGVAEVNCNPCSCRVLEVESININCGTDELVVEYNNDFDIIPIVVDAWLFLAPSTTIPAVNINWLNGILEFDISTAPDGNYLLFVEDEDGCIYTHPITISCDVACDSCTEQVLYMNQDRALAFLLENSIENATGFGSIFLECADGDVQGKIPFASALQTFLTNQGECSNPTIDFECIAYDGSIDANSCVTPSDPIVKITINNAATQILGIYNGTGCFIAKETRFDVVSGEIDCVAEEITLEIDTPSGYVGDITATLQSPDLSDTVPLAPVSIAAGTWTFVFDVSAFTPITGGQFSNWFFKLELDDDCIDLVMVKSWITTPVNC